MTDSPEVGTFDIADMFSGKAYPKDTVTVYLDEKTAYDINKLSERSLKALSPRDEEEGQKIENELEALRKKGAESKYVFHLTGVSREVRQSILDKVLEEFPMETDFLGRQKQDPQADDAFANLTWATHIEKIEAPSGAVKVSPTPADVKILRGNLPDSEVDKIESGINAFSTGAKSGFETLAQEPDFLS